jgi:hypothetical protein
VEVHRRLELVEASLQFWYVKCLLNIVRSYRFIRLIKRMANASYIRPGLPLSISSASYVLN